MLKQRIITASILAILALLSIFYTDAMLWQAIVLAVTIVAAWEWAALARIRSVFNKANYTVLVSALAMFAMQGLPFIIFLILALIQLLVFIFYVLRFQTKRGQLENLNSFWVGLMGLISLVPFSYALFHLREAFGASALLLAMSAVWAVDIGAYFSGRRFGKTKLAVHVSPGKTWEGVWGGAAITFVLMAVFVSVFTPFAKVPVAEAAFLLTLVALISVFGDLYESVLKRQANLKDSGQILPGHGGVLDRIDSLILALPLLLLAWSIWPHLAGKI